MHVFIWYKSFRAILKWIFNKFHAYGIASFSQVTNNMAKLWAHKTYIIFDIYCISGESFTWIYIVYTWAFPWYFKPIIFISRGLFLGLKKTKQKKCRCLQQGSYSFLLFNCIRFATNPRELDNARGNLADGYSTRQEFFAILRIQN